MKLAQKKLLNRIIIVALLTTLLTFNVGRVQSVKAVGTTVAAVAGAATLAVGIGFLSYCALTGMAIHCPQTMEDIQVWLTDVGSRVVQYPSGHEAYEEIYEQMLDEPAHAFLDRAWSWTRDKLMNFTNDFSDTRVISNILGYTYTPSFDNVATNGFTYPYSFSTPIDRYYFDGSYYTYDQLIARGWSVVYPTGALRDTEAFAGNQHVLVPTNVNNPVRNVLLSNGKYSAEQFVDGVWTSSGSGSVGNYIIAWGDYHVTLPEENNGQLIWHGYQTDGQIFYFGGETTYPLFPQEVIYVQATDTYLPMVDTGEQVESPTWPDVNDPDDEVEYPIVPYTQLPLDVYGGGGNPNPRWQFNLDDLLDILCDLGEAIFDLTVLKNLINALGGDDGNIYYDITEEGDTINNYEYYITNHYNYGDVTYNIDVSEADEHLPVDLNTIQIYTSNRYLDTIKRSASGIGSVIGEWFAFWHNVDPEIVYVIFGAGILTIIGAFIGKWGHS